MNEKSKRKQEWDEVYLSTPELFDVWGEEVIKTRQKLNSSSLDDLIDVIRSSSLRAKLGRDRDNEFLANNFRLWTTTWSNLKSMALIKTVLLRGKGDRRILVAYSVDENQPEDHYKERLTFVFLTGARPYRTSTALSNLTRFVTREALMGSIGESDQLPQLPKPRRFYT